MKKAILTIATILMMSTSAHAAELDQLDNGTWILINGDGTWTRTTDPNDERKTIIEPVKAKPKATIAGPSKSLHTLVRQLNMDQADIKCRMAIAEATKTKFWDDIPRAWYREDMGKNFGLNNKNNTRCETTINNGPKVVYLTVNGKVIIREY